MLGISTQYFHVVRMYNAYFPSNCLILFQIQQIKNESNCDSSEKLMIQRGCERSDGLKKEMNFNLSVITEELSSFLASFKRHCILDVRYLVLSMSALHLNFVNNYLPLDALFSVEMKTWCGKELWGTTSVSGSCCISSCVFKNVTGKHPVSRIKK